MLDLLISGGSVIDGTGAGRFVADVGVEGGRIVAVGALSGQSARQMLDADGAIVCPGFIDAHAHDDRLLLDPPELHPKLSQGVTTVVTGNCGISLAPLVMQSVPAPLDILGQDQYRFAEFSDYLAALDAIGSGVNVAALVGHTTLRVGSMSEWDRRATLSECRRMRDHLDRALLAGAWGLSTGLYYPPASAATADEVVAVAQPLAKHSGVLAMHLRDESDEVDAALREAIAIAREADAPLVVSHHKLLGLRNHGRSVETLALIEAAAQSRPVCMDCYPYAASSTSLFPHRVRECTEVLVSWSQAVPEAAGRSLFELAREWGKTPEQAAHALQPAGAIYFAMSECDVDRILSHPLTMVGSDGLPHDRRPHPRLWGTFSRVLGPYVRDKHLFTLETAIHKMTGMPALRFGISGRGAIEAGCAADLVVFDPETIGDRADYADPEQASTGIHAVIVNGTLVMLDGRPIGGRAGQVLRRPAR
jgi:N-acyl-D-amino-acid deacylase